MVNGSFTVERGILDRVLVHAYAQCQFCCTAYYDQSEGPFMMMTLALTGIYQTFTHAIYCLASQPQYISILRAEVEQQLDSGDTTTWTRDALGRCVKLDSFLKETLRLHGLGAIWMPRLAVSDFSFSDGTNIPPGYFVATAATAVHENDALYENSRDFNGLRFSSMRKGTFGRPETEKDWQYKMTSNSESYLAFGGGRHLWSVLHCLSTFLSQYPQSR